MRQIWIKAAAAAALSATALLGLAAGTTSAAVVPQSVCVHSVSCFTGS